MHKFSDPRHLSAICCLGDVAPSRAKCVRLMVPLLMRLLILGHLVHIFVSYRLWYL